MTGGSDGQKRDSVAVKQPRRTYISVDTVASIFTDKA
jgi:hypothetical protein